MSDFLFGEFDEVSAKEWKQKIQTDLKGADYNETLIWKTLEGIDVKPFYHQDDFKNKSIDIKGHPKSWRIAQEVFIDDESIANTLMLDAIERGADAVFITSEDKFNIKTVFANFPFEKSNIYFSLKFLSEEFYLKLSHFFLNKKVTVFYNIDIIGNLAHMGNWFHNLKQDHTIISTIIQKNYSENILSVDGSLYHNSGANMVQQLAYCLAQANEYLNHFQNLIPIKQKDRESQLLPITFKLSVGTNYFFEIAKIRALRKIYAILAVEYGVSKNCHIITMPSKRNKTLYDYNVNLLRTTTEDMSAILGGSNTVCGLAYDAIYHKSNEFGERIARNQLQILKRESYFNSSDNPAKGSYYIESLTDQLSEKALNLFKDIETNGGILRQLKEGTIQRKIKESAEKEQKLFDSGELVLLGTNIHENNADRMKDDVELYPFKKFKSRKTLIEPVIEKRLSEKNEQERLNKE